jgi:midasin (ATPase involved in ribosome maturation)
MLLQIVECLVVSMEEGVSLIPDKSNSLFQQLIQLKCLRILLKLGYLKGVHRCYLRLESLLTRFSEANDMIKYQILSMLCEGYEFIESFQLNVVRKSFSEENYKNCLQIDILLETYFSGRTSVDADNAIIKEAESHLSSFQNMLISFTSENNVDPAVKLFVQVDDCLLPKRYSAFKGSDPSSLTDKDLNGELVHTSTTKQNLYHLMQAIITEKPVLLSGTAGSGKSSIIRELSILTGNHKNLIVLHINEQTDGKSLIGSYVCTDIPGEFIWQAGIITQAVLNGYWLVIEDIDYVNLEIISLLSLLLESRLLLLPNSRQPIKAHYNFRIFGTRTVTSIVSPTTDVDDQVTIFSSSTYLSFHRNFSYVWYHIRLETLPFDEIMEIVSFKYSNVPKSLLLGCLNLSIPSTSSSSVAVSSSKQGKPLTLHEIFKLMSRFSCYFQASSSSSASSSATSSSSIYITDSTKSMIVLDLFDILCGKIRNKEKAISFMMLIGNSFNIPNSEIEHLISFYLPQFDLVQMNETRHLTIGRTVLSSSVADLSSSFSASNASFALTNYSKRFLEKMAVSIQMKEPILLVGETGGGKTTSIQELAKLLGKKLLVQNLSLSSDLNDLLGGYRPVTVRQLLLPQYEQFVRLFQETLSSSSSKNHDYLRIVANCFQEENWSKLLKAFEKAINSAITKLSSETGNISELTEVREKRKIVEKLEEWKRLQKVIKRFESNLSRIENGFAFAFQKGLLYEAMEKGYWILLDEINLASSETLQILSNILDFKNSKKLYSADLNNNNDDNDGNSSSSSSGTGGLTIHSDFFLFAAMNPPTDICKKELPESLRNRFTEFYVEELVDSKDLHIIVSNYLKDIADAPISDIVNVYLGCRQAASISLSDGAGQSPRYSLRSLTRSLKAALTFLKSGMRPFRRCLYEGFLLNFHSMLNEKSRLFMEEFLKQSLFSEGKTKDFDFPSSRPGGKSSKAEEWTLVKPFWIRTGPEEQVDWAAETASSSSSSSVSTKFVPTKSVLKNIRTIASAISSNIAAVLLQGPTSVGKTTMIQYIAAKAGYKCVRINNHEHTDVSEYLGSYITGSDGNLIFQDGLLVQALRKGWWIILDELNLAPSDILEALNRLLDDNREVLIPETGEIVKPVEGFFLFATQNPAGIYGGRKPLSLAFRNRFIEIDIPDLPNKEIEDIITKSCIIAPKFSTMLVKVMIELQRNRQNSSALLGKSGMITVRDLIKWGKRSPQSAADVAKEGIMLIVEKLRSKEEKAVVSSIISDVCKVKISSEELFEGITAGKNSSESSQELTKAYEMLKRNELNVSGVNGVAITKSLSRMWTLLWNAFKHFEPVLLIGEAGCGKTMICQLYAAYKGQELRILNCHQSTETTDIIGGYRPVRGREAAKIRLNSLLNTIVSSLMTYNIEKDFFTSVVSSPSSPSLSGSALCFDEKYLSQVIEKLQEISRNSSSLLLLPSELQSSLSEKTFREISELQTKLNSIFEWCDGPLIEAMKNGEVFLLDEINLAEDAVIERINSVLEFHREITIAEKATDSNNNQKVEKLIAHPNFRIIATMNPSGDFGKRELSPALRSRFTEVWVPSILHNDEIITIIEEILAFPHELTEQFIRDASAGSSKESNSLAHYIGCSILSFIEKINEAISVELSGKSLVTIREILAWTTFINQLSPSSIEEVFYAFLHGAFLIILDGLGLGQSFSRLLVKQVKQLGLQYLLDLCPSIYRSSLKQSIIYLVDPSAIEEALSFVRPQIKDDQFVLGTFSVELGAEPIKRDPSYTLETSTTILNLGRILRAMKIHRPILIEGPPGVGKSSLIANLAASTGHKLVRINLSEHSELSDLLGSDLPVSSSSSSDSDSSSSSARFKWYDGIFLTAMKQGYWVLLDELNLAPQNVLEGLNACFDHRSEVFLPEIGQTIHCSSSFRVFCTQNPMIEGGGRKGLPASFLSRFTRVYIESLNNSDMYEIISRVISNTDKPLLVQTESFSTQEVMAVSSVSILDSISVGSMLSLQDLSEDIRKMIQFLSLIDTEMNRPSSSASFGKVGSPWEFNLRDIFRWYECLRYFSSRRNNSISCATSAEEEKPIRNVIVSYAVFMIFIIRMRTKSDRIRLCELFKNVFQFDLIINSLEWFSSSSVSSSFLSVSEMELLALNPAPHSRVSYSRQLSSSLSFSTYFDNKENFRLQQLIEHAILLKWPVLLVGTTRSGKRSCLERLAKKFSSSVRVFSVIPSLDSSELIGTFEQSTLGKRLSALLEEVMEVALNLLSYLLSSMSSMDTTSSFLKLNEALSVIESSKKEVELLDKMEDYSILKMNCNFSSNFQRIINPLWEVSTFLSSSSSSSLSSNIFVSYQTTLQSIFGELQMIFDSEGKILDNYRGQFVWNNGIVIDAAIKGDWLILDNINLASASVLDRINSILEPNGSIILTEDGLGKEIIPHPSFRIFLTMDPSYGEISRAMRNRCLELYFLKEEDERGSGKGNIGVASTQVGSFLGKESSVHHIPLIQSFFRACCNGGDTASLMFDVVTALSSSQLKGVSSMKFQKFWSDLSTVTQLFGFSSKNQFIQAVLNRFPTLSNHVLQSTSQMNSYDANLLPVVFSCSSSLNCPELLICFFLISRLSSVAPSQQCMGEWTVFIVERMKELSSFHIESYSSLFWNSFLNDDKGDDRNNSQNFIDFHQNLITKLVASFGSVSSDRNQTSSSSFVESIVVYLLQFLSTTQVMEVPVLLEMVQGKTSSLQSFTFLSAVYQQAISASSSSSLTNSQTDLFYRRGKILLKEAAANLHPVSQSFINPNNLYEMILATISSSSSSFLVTLSSHAKKSLEVLKNIWNFLNELERVYSSLSISETKEQRNVAWVFSLIDSMKMLFFISFSEYSSAKETTDEHQKESSSSSLPIDSKSWNSLIIGLEWLIESISSIPSSPSSESIQKNQILSHVDSLIKEIFLFGLQIPSQLLYKYKLTKYQINNRFSVPFIKEADEDTQRKEALSLVSSDSFTTSSQMSHSAAVLLLWNCLFELRRIGSSSKSSTEGDHQSSSSIVIPFLREIKFSNVPEENHLNRDWLALYSTYYLHFTNESLLLLPIQEAKVGKEIKSQNQLSTLTLEGLHLMIEKLKEKYSTFAETTRIASFEEIIEFAENLSISDKETYLFSDSQVKRRIESELFFDKIMIENRMMMNDLIYDKMKKIRDSLSLILLSSGCSSSDCSVNLIQGFKGLVQEIKNVCNLFLAFSLYNALYLRELQSLLWTFEYLLAVPALSMEIITKLSFFIRRCLLGVDFLFYQMISHQETSVSQYSKSSFLTNTLCFSLLQQQNNEIDLDTLGNVAPYSSGNKNSCFFLRLLSESVDPRMIVSNQLLSDSWLRSVTSKYDGTTLFSYSAMIDNLLISFQSSLYLKLQQWNEESKEKQRISQTSMLEGIPRLIQYLMEILEGCFDCFNAEGQVLLRTTFASASLHLVSSQSSDRIQVLLTSFISPLIDYSIVKCITDASLQSIFQSCLLPILQSLMKISSLLLSSSSYLSSIQIRSEIGYCFALIGFLRLHFLIPIGSSFDPMIKPFYQSSFLKPIVNDLSGQIAGEMIINSFTISNDLFYNQHLVNKIDDVISLQKKINSLNGNVISRPFSSSSSSSSSNMDDSYSEFLNFLRSLVEEGSFSFDSFLSFIHSFRSSSSNGNINSQNKKVAENHFFNISSIISNLMRNYYSYFEDLVVPIVSSMENIVFGIQTMMSSDVSLFSADKSHNMIVKSRKQDKSDPWESLSRIINRCFSSFLFNSSPPATVSLDELSVIVDELLLLITSNSLVLSSEEVFSLNPFVIHCLFVLYYLITQLSSSTSSSFSCFHQDSSTVASLLEKLIQCYGLKYLEYHHEKVNWEKKNASYYSYKEKDGKSNDSSASYGGDHKDEEKEKEEELFREMFPDHTNDLTKLLTSSSADSDDENEGEQQDIEEKKRRNRKNENSSEDSKGYSFQDEIIIKIFDQKILLHFINILSQFVLFSSSSPLRYSVTSFSFHLTSVENKLSSKHLSDLLFLKNYDDSMNGDPSVSSDSSYQSSYQFLLSLQFNHYYSLTSGVSSNMTGSLPTDDIDDDLQLLLNLTSHSFFPSSSPVLPKSSNDQKKKLLKGKQAEKERNSFYPHDFQFDSYMTEVTRIISPLQHIQEKIALLLSSFPSNEILLKIMKLINQIFYDYHVTSSLGKLLSACQLILKTLQEWELNAAKHVSLSVEMKEISTLLNDWRNIELKSWNNLLRSKEVELIMTNCIEKHFFSLFKIYSLDMYSFLDSLFVKKSTSFFQSLLKQQKLKKQTKHVSSSSSTSVSRWKTLSTLAPSWMFSSEKKTIDTSSISITLTEEEKKEVTEYENKINEYLNKLMKSLDSLLRSSSVGEFPTFLHFLRLMALYLHSSFESSSSSSRSSSSLARRKQSLIANEKNTIKRRIMKLTLGIWEYYFSFLPLIRRFQSLMKKPIEDKIKNEVKLGKWDSLNLYALIEISEKINRKLNKFLHEYDDEVLRFPIFSLLHKDLSKDLINDNGEIIPSITIPLSSSLFPQLSTIEATAGSSTSSLVLKGKKEAEWNEFLSLLESSKITPVSLVSSAASSVFSFAALVSVSASYPHLSRVVSLQKKFKKYLFQLFDFKELKEEEELRRKELFSESSMEVKNSDEMRAEVDNTASVLPVTSFTSSKISTISYGFHGYSLIESFSQEIFSRLDEYRSNESITKPMKLKSVRDLLVYLQECGYSPLRSSLPSIFHDTTASLTDHRNDISHQNHHFQNIVLEISEILPLTQAYSLTSASSSSSVVHEMLKKGESYYMRNIIEFTQLKTQSLTIHSSDLSKKEVDHMIILSENMILQNMKMRIVMESSLVEVRGLAEKEQQLNDSLVAMKLLLKEQTRSNLANSSTSDSSPSSCYSLSSVSALFSQKITIANSLLTSFLSLKELVQTAIESQKKVLSTSNNEKHLLMDLSSLSVFSDEELKQFNDFIIKSLISLKLLFIFSSSSSSTKEKKKDKDTTLVLQERRITFEEKQKKLSHCHELSASLLSTLPLYEKLIFILFASSHDYDKMMMESKRLSIEVTSDSQSILPSVEDNDDMEVDNQPSSSLSVTAAPFAVPSSEVNVFKVGNKMIEDCLLIVQRLKSFQQSVTNLSSLASSTSSPSSFIGCFGETLLSSDIDASSSSSSFNLCQLVSLSISSLSSFKLTSFTSTLQSFISSMESQLSVPSSSASSASASLISSERASSYLSLLSTLKWFSSLISSSYQATFHQMILLYKSLNKLTYLIVRIFRNLLVKGICSNPNDENEEEGKEGNNNDNNDLSKMKFEDDQEGTGMGEGEGKKDVSDQIENEEQLLGNKEEKTMEELEKDRSDDNNQTTKEQKEKLSKEEQEKGMEMENDFDGEMFDLEEKGEEEEDEDDQEEEEKEEDPEREMGEANLEDIIDQKQWESEDEEEKDDDEEEEKEGKGKKEKEKFQKDSKGKGKKLDEMTTTDKDEEEGDDNDEKKGQNEEEDGEGSDNDDDDNGQGEDDEEGGKINEDNEEDYMEKPQGIETKEKQKKPQQSGEEEKEEEQEGEDGGEGEDVEEKDEGGEEEKDDFQEVNDASSEPMPNEGEEEADGKEQDDKDDDFQLNEDDAMDLGDEEGMNEDDDRNERDDINEEPGDDEDNQMDVDDEEEGEPEADITDDKEEEIKERPITFGVQSETGNEEILNSKEKDENNQNASEEKKAKKEQRQKESSESQQNNNEKPDQNERQSGGEEGKETSSNQSVDEQTKKEENKLPSYEEPSNPFLSKGNLEKEWFRRLNIIPPSSSSSMEEENLLNDDNQPEEENNEENNPLNEGTAKEYEYDNNPNSNQPYEQVLGKTKEKQNDSSSNLQTPNQQNEILPPPPSNKEEEKHLYDDDDERAKKEEDEASKKRDRVQSEEEIKQSNQQANNKEKQQRKRQKTTENVDEKKENEKDNRKHDSSSSEEEERMNDEEEKNDDQAVNENNEKDEKENQDVENLFEERNEIKTSSSFLFGDKQTKDDVEEEEERMEDENEDRLDEDNLPSSSAVVSFSSEEEKAFINEWNYYKNKTETSSIQLCESLKLILEPMLMTKLQGFYRSGKKLSMKKVISYISSNYRKDKIWLKRRKPSSRNYQIFLLIDNSKSMKFLSSKTIETIVLLQQTFSKLEIGQLSIGTFGEELNILFPFPNMSMSTTTSASSSLSSTSKNALILNDDAGFHLLSNLSFDSNTTQLNASLSSAIPYLLSAKDSLMVSNLSSSSSSSSSMILQICFIISDARIDSENRLQLEKIIQKMSEEHILVILLIIDDPTSSDNTAFASSSSSSLANIVKKNNNSILNTKVISFVGNEIITKSYFDDFPFPYYLIIQNIQQLPDILTEALKQWFELIKLQLSSSSSGGGK